MNSTENRVKKKYIPKNVTVRFWLGVCKQKTLTH